MHFDAPFTPDFDAITHLAGTSTQVEPTPEQTAHAHDLERRAAAIQQPSEAARLSLLLDQLANLRAQFDTAYKNGVPWNAADHAESYFEAADRLFQLLNPRDIGGETSGIAVTINGLDIYVHDQGARLAVSVNADDAAKPAVVESFDGISWEHELS